MRTFSGLVLLAGLGVGLFVYLPAPVDRDTSLQNAQRSGTSTVAKQRERVVAASEAQPALRSFSPGVSLVAMAHDTVPSVTRPDPLGGWRTTSASDPQYRTLEPTNPESRYRLVVDIQQELKRMGCYWGRVDGSWGPGTKDALQSFMTRVNAALPSDKPDYVLLTLLKSQSREVCGACPADQVQLSGGQCVPQTTVAYGQPNTDATLLAHPRRPCPGKRPRPRRPSLSSRRFPTASCPPSPCPAAWPSAPRQRCLPSIRFTHRLQSPRPAPSNRSRRQQPRPPPRLAPHRSRPRPTKGRAAAKAQGHLATI